MRGLYTLLTWCLAPFAFAVVLWRGFQERAYWLGLRERFGFGRTLGGAAVGARAASGCTRCRWARCRRRRR